MEQKPRLQAFLAGVGAGLILALSDWSASGLARTPLVLVLAILVSGVLGGALAGAIAARFASPALGAALVLCGGIGLEGLARTSKEIPASTRSIAALLVLACALAGLLAARTLHRSPFPRATSAGAVLSLPAGVFLAEWLSSSPWGHLAGITAPLLCLAFERATRGRRTALAALWLGLVLVLALAQRESTGGARPTQKAAVAPVGTGPSVVLLVIDTLRADAVAPDGELARFAREGVEFRQCVSAAPWTLPSVGSLLTGLYPSQHGAVTAATRLSAEVSTLAELLAARGYATGAFTGGAFVGTAHGLERGFEVFDPTCERRFIAFGGHTPLIWRVAKNRYLPLRWLMGMVDVYRGLEGGLAAARAWAARGSGPKFLFLHTYQVHDYYLYEPDLDDAVLGAVPAPSERFEGRLWVDPKELMQASAGDLEHFRALYQGRVDSIERLFPTLVRELTPLVGEDAVWIVTADHGEGFDAVNQRVHHGGRLHDDLLRVPLIVRAKGRLTPGMVVEEPVRTIDVLPTVLELLGLSIPAGLAGESLLPALRGERIYPAAACAEERVFDLVALRRDGWKLIRGPRHQELYDLGKDPCEGNSIVGEPPAQLLEELAAFRTRYPARSSAEVELDSATLEHLRALGYVH